VTGIPVPGADQRRALRRMKLVATWFLVVAAVVYVVCVVVGDGQGLWGYLQTAAEASMVGGLADWFAVTALFRHPLGVPIPHTAIIPRKKDQIGAALGNFVQQNFLTPSIVGERLTAAQIPRRAGEWLADPVHAARIAQEAGDALNGLATLVRDDEIRHAVARYADKKLRDIELAPVLARVLDTVRESGQHQVVLTAGLKGLMRFLDDNRLVFRARLGQESPEWIPNWVDERLFNRLFAGVQSFLADVVANDTHELRSQFDRYLREYGDALRTDPAKAARVEAAKIELLEREDVRDWLSTLWLHMKKAILDAAADPESDLRHTIASVTRQFGESLRDDPALAARVDAALQRIVNHVVARYGRDAAELISSTVERWDSADTSRRLELQVGRDLQFIRLNGTVVGAIVGVLIHAVGQLL
jgi:uncharacterized membrane-anchored protein YjiN (DUF445 family)